MATSILVFVLQKACFTLGVASVVPRHQERFGVGDAACDASSLKCTKYLLLAYCQISETIYIFQMC